MRPELTRTVIALPVATSSLTLGLVGAVPVPMFSSLSLSELDKPHHVPENIANREELKSIIENISIREINYASLYLMNISTFIDDVWDLYDLYFPPPDSLLTATPPFSSTLTSLSTSETPTPPATPTSTPRPTSTPGPTVAPSASTDYENERDRFTLAFLISLLEFVVGAAASGVIGNLAYDVLKKELMKLRDTSSFEARKCVDKTLQELDGIAKRLRQAEEKGEAIYVRELAKYVGGDIVKARTWAKLFGMVHTSSCYWYFPKGKSMTEQHTQTKGAG